MGSRFLTRKTEWGDDYIPSPDGKGKYLYIYSPDQERKYRYWLEAKLCERPKKDGAVLFIMMNPATKYCEIRKSRTTRDKCEDFAEKWGYGTLWTCNLFGFADKNPAVLKDNSYIGPNNDKYILRYARQADKIVCAWGDGKGKNGKSGERKFRIARGNYVLHMLKDKGFMRNMYFLESLTERCQPRHPQYLSKDSQRISYHSLWDSLKAQI